jgi:hypothetical protein
VNTLICYAMSVSVRFNKNAVPVYYLRILFVRLSCPTTVISLSYLPCSLRLKIESINKIVDEID